MSGPKHLWSGDWERESSEAQRRRARPEAGPEPAVDPPARAPEGDRGRTRRRRRLAAALAALVVGAGGVAFAAIAIHGSHHSRGAALEQTGTAPLTVTTPRRSFSVPTTPTTTTTPTTPTPTATPPIKWLGMEIVTGASGHAVIDTVKTSGAGGLAGLNPGDTILAVAGHAIAGPQSLAPALRGLKSGEQVPIEVVRGSNLLTLQVTLGNPPHRYP
jgi:predicted metalloprotease with PDZ domain